MEVTRIAVTKVWTEENSQFCCWVTFECQEKLMENGYLNKSIMPSAKFLKLLWRVIDAVGSNFILPKTWVMKGNKNKKLRITQNSKYDLYSKRIWGTPKFGRYQHKDLGTKTGNGDRGQEPEVAKIRMEQRAVLSPGLSEGTCDQSLGSYKGKNSGAWDKKLCTGQCILRNKINPWPKKWASTTDTI